jgi:hypothetical protein
MLQSNGQNLSDNIIRELKSSQILFHNLSDNLNEEDRKKPSLNPGWTNGEILAHILFGFIILNALLPLVKVFSITPRITGKAFAGFLNLMIGPFNFINAIGARLQGKVFVGSRLEKLYDQVIKSLINKALSMRAQNWSLGMYYPTKWDSNFPDYMTIEKLFNYPIIHQQFHIKQIAR